MEQLHVSLYMLLEMQRVRNVEHISICILPRSVSLRSPERPCVAEAEGNVVHISCRLQQRAHLKCQSTNIC